MSMLLQHLPLATYGVNVVVCVRWELISPPAVSPVLHCGLPTFFQWGFALQGSLNPAVLELLAAVCPLSLGFTHFICQLTLSPPAFRTVGTALLFALHFGLKSGHLRPGLSSLKSSQSPYCSCLPAFPKSTAYSSTQTSFLFLFRFKTL